MGVGLYGRISDLKTYGPARIRRPGIPRRREGARFPGKSERKEGPWVVGVRMGEPFRPFPRLAHWALEREENGQKTVRIF